MPNDTTNPKRDYRQEVTDNIIKMLEQGTTQRKGAADLVLIAGPGSSAELFNSQTGIFTSTESMIMPRAGAFIATSLANGKVLVAGSATTSGIPRHFCRVEKSSSQEDSILQ